jgi:tetratricopeptide (TPR) repeat protein
MLNPRLVLNLKSNPQRSSIYDVVAPKTIRQFTGLRAKPQIMFGRNNEINVIVNALVSGEDTSEFEKAQNNQRNLPPRICILGTGGIGKTTLSLSILHHDLVIKKFGAERIFVSCEAATSFELLLGEIAGTLSIAVSHVTDDLFKAIIRRLQEGACLLVLDNFETPWDPPQTRSEIEMLLTQITALQTVTVIITMRGAQKPAGTKWSDILPPLQPVDLDSAIAIFQAIVNKTDEHAIDLIRAVDCIPLAVTLIANLAAVDGETTEALWLRWQEESTAMVESGQDRLTSLETSIQLSLSSPRMQRDPNALSLLSAFSLLPDGISLDTIRVCEKGLPGMASVKKSLSTLRQNALFYEDENKDLRLLSPIRLFMISHHPPPSQSRTFIYNHFIDLASQGAWCNDASVRARLNREVGNINAILLDALGSSTQKNIQKLVEASISFCHYVYISGAGSQQAIELSIEKLKSVKFSTAIPSSPPPAAKNKSFWKKGSLFAKAKTIKPGAAVKEPTLKVDPTLKLQADCLGCLGQVLSRQRKFDLAGEKFRLAKDIHIQIGDLLGQAYDLLNIGLLLSWETESSEVALAVFKEATGLHEQLNDSVGMAHGLMGAGHILRDLYKFEESETKFSTAASLFAEMEDDSGQASALYGLGMLMVSKSRFPEAEKYFIEATQLSISSGDIIGQAESVAGLAVTYLLRSRFSEAHDTILKALSLRDSFVDPDHLHILGRVFIAEGDMDQAEITLNRSLNQHNILGDHRGGLDDAFYLAEVHLYKGDIKSAKRYARTASQCKTTNMLFRAQVDLLLCQIALRCGDYDYLDSFHWPLGTFSGLECMLGQARCLYMQGLYQIVVCDNLEAAKEHFSHALKLHDKVGNIQGKADDMNKICEILKRQGSLHEALTLISEALALHIQIDDNGGQADDLCVQAGIFLEQGRFGDAESTMRMALKMHEQVKSKYGMARDLAILSDILLNRHQNGEDGDKSEEALACIRQAMKLFGEVGAAQEFFECRQQKRRTKGQKPLDKSWVRLPDFYTSSDDEDESVSDDILI